MTTTRAATHKGNCQVCGALQKLPEGRLAKHGYSVRFGFFEGVCNGSHNLPFQISIGMIKAAIANAESMIKANEAKAAELLKPATTNVGWISEYIPAVRRGETSHNQWAQKALEMVRNQNPGSDYVWYSFKYTPSDNAMKLGAGKLEFPLDVRPASGIEAATKCNAIYVERVINKRIKELKGYVSWQRERIKNWKPSDLIPLAGKAVAA